MGEAYLPAGWPKAVAPPGSQDWEASAVAWLLDLVPDLRGHSAVRRHPVILAVIARHTVTSPSVLLGEVTQASRGLGRPLVSRIVQTLGGNPWCHFTGWADEGPRAQGMPNQ
jgi:hypothetical protein